MADLTSEEINKLTNAIQDQTRQVQGAFGTDWKNWKEAATSAGESALALGFLTKAAFTQSDTLTKLTTGSYKLNDGLNDFKGMIGLVLSPLGKFGAGVKNLATNSVDAALAVNTSLNKVAQNGVYFANNLGEYAEKVTSAGMSMTEFEQLVQKSAAALSGFGASMDSGSKRYLESMEELRQTDIIKTLMKTGQSQEEINKSSLAYLSRTNFLNSQHQQSQGQLIEDLAKFNESIDNLTRITGLSRKEQEATIEQQKQRAQVESFMLNATDKQQKAMNTAIQETTGMGPRIQYLAEEMVMNNGDVITKAGSDVMQKLGPVAGSTLQEYTKAKLAGDTDRAEKLLETFKQQAVEFAGSYEGRTLQQQYPEFAEVLGPLVHNIGNSQKALEDEAAFRNISIEQAKKERDEQIKRDRDLGKDDQQLAAAINTANRTTADASIAVAKGFNNLNSIVGNSIKNLDLFNSALLKIRSPEELKAIGNKYTPKPPAEPATVAPKRYATGTTGVLGSLFGDFGSGTPAILDGKEAVMTEAQFGELFSNAMNAKPAQPSKGMFDNISDMFYDVGNMAGKMFDGASKKTASTSTDADLKSRIEHLNKAGYDSTNPYVQRLQNNLNELHKPKSSANTIEAQRSTFAAEKERDKKIAEERAKKDAEEQKRQTDKAKQDAAAAEKKPEAEKKDATINDLKDLLVDLNKNMVTMISHIDVVAQHTEKQTRSINGLSSNRLKPGG